VKKVAADPSEIPSPPELKIKKEKPGKEKEVKTRKMAASVSASMFQSSASSGGIGGNAMMDAPITKEQKASALSGFLLNRPSKEMLVQKNIMSKVEAEAATAGVTPLKLDIFHQLCKFLEQHIELQGLFRISGGLQDVRALYLQFGGSGALDMKSAIDDPHTATGALKLYLREQKDPLIPFSLYAECLKAQRMRDTNAQLQAIRTVVAKLPEPNLSIVKHLMDFLRRVAAKSAINLMNPGNLGIVFGPTIMWDPDTTSLNFENTNVQSGFVVSMITSYDFIFNGESPAAGAPATPAAAASDAPAHAPAPPSGVKKMAFTLPPAGFLPKRSSSMVVSRKPTEEKKAEEPPKKAEELQPMAFQHPIPTISAPLPPPVVTELAPPSPTKGTRSPRPPSGEILLPPPPPPAEEPADDEDDESDSVSVEDVFAFLRDGSGERKETRSMARKALRNEAEFAAHAETHSPKELTKILLSLMKHITKQ
jgi:hypothetical protein